jgi:CMP/dCMP kinase
MKSVHALVIAVDGYSSCGKSTFARMIAKELNFVYIDSGAMYRAVALFCLNNKILNDTQPDLDLLHQSMDLIHIRFSLNPQNGIQETWLNNNNVEKDIRGIEVSSVVSRISQVRAVRQKMVSLQRKIGAAGSVVMDGRDIGTIVFPEATLKIFMTADMHIRAMRRFKELTEKGVPVQMKEIEENIRMRDYEDENRSESPLRKADNALVLDNSQMTIEQQMEWFHGIWKTITE